MLLSKRGRKRNKLSPKVACVACGISRGISRASAFVSEAVNVSDEAVRGLVNVGLRDYKLKRLPYILAMWRDWKISGIKKTWKNTYHDAETMFYPRQKSNVY